MGGDDGGEANSYQFTMLLLGMGLRTLTKIPAKISLVKRVVRSSATSSVHALQFLLAQTQDYP